jgi:hydroxymethylpyrimidine pyrophosphatase-like HAD family hydrolase
MFPFRALAVDYDGSLAAHDRIAEPAVAALERARQAGLRLILVTGRTFFELTRVCARIDLFDAVVAENGAVLHDPREGTICDEAPGPAPRLLAELDRRSIPFQIGRVIIGTGRSYEAGVRAAMAAAGVHLDLVCNRAALMLLPSGISKGTGVRRVIRRQGLSFHDVLAIGDAENDLELFAACGFTACPGNAVAEVLHAADWVFPGDNGSAIASAIAGPILGGTLPAPRSARERIDLGWARATAEPVTIPAHGINVLAQGDSLSGKSWLAGGLVERLVARDYATCVIDPEGDYQGLAGVTGVTWMELEDSEKWKDVLEVFRRDPAASVVVDVSAFPHESKLGVIGDGLAALQVLRRGSGLPHWIVLDEAHYWLHRQGIPDAAAGLRDKGFWLITYKPSSVRESVLASVDLFVFGRTTASTELDSLRPFIQWPLEWSAAMTEVLRDLSPPEFLLVPAHAGAPAGAVTFVAPSRSTSQVRHVGKYSDRPVLPSEAFFFQFDDGRLAATADTLRTFLARLRDVDGEVLGHHASRGDFSRWLADVFRYRHLSSQVRKIEQRWSRRHGPPLRAALVRLIGGAVQET